MILQEFKHLFFGEELNLEGELTEEVANKYLSEEILNKKSKEFRKVPIDSIFDILQRTAMRLCDRNGVYYKEIIEKMPDLLGYSTNMVEMGMDILPELLSAKVLKGRLKSLGEYHALDHFTREKHCKVNRAMPVGAVLHIAAGNIFIGAIDSIVTGMITKNVNVLKASSQDLLFPSLFYKALKDVDVENLIIPYTAITYWSRKNVNLEKIAKKNFEAILLFGGEEAVINYKNGLSAKTEVYSFGPKISYGLISGELTEAQLKEVAEGFCDDIVYWEQRACTSCQNIFIEDSNDVETFAKYVYEALEKKGREFPQCKFDLDAAVEIRKEREKGKWREFNNKGSVLEGKSANHTIIIQDSTDAVYSPLNRTIYINKIKNYTELLEGNLSSLKYYMSTLAIASPKNLQNIVEKFMELGVMRFCKPGAMACSDDAEAPHDGMYLPNLLVRFISKENLPMDSFGLEYVEKEEKDKLLVSRLNGLINEALKSPFYKKFYENVSLPLRSLEDFKKLPVLEKSYIYENSVDKSMDMLTDEMKGCYVFSAGGTTGKMKYVVYSKEEFEASKKVFGHGFRAIGINENDFAANYMRAGALWTAFSAVNEGLEETGCRILSLTANQSEKETIEYLKIFKPNVLISLPSNIILLAQEVENLKEDIKIDRIFYGGEHMSLQGQEYVKKVLKTEKIASLGYAAVEIGPIGLQCECCNGTEHHVMDEWCYVETDDEGDVFVTALKKTLHPIIRYRIGDRIQWVDEPCACGRTSKKFKLLSRTDDLIRFNVSDIYLNDVFGALKEFDEISSFFQILVENVGERRDVTIKIETKGALVNCNESMLLDKISHSLKTKIKCIGIDKEKNLIGEIKVELLPPYGIDRVGRTGKIRRIVDKRI